MVYQSRFTWAHWRHSIQQSLLPLVLPWRCVCCGAAGGTRISLPQSEQVVDLCADCYPLLPINDHACQQCALPLVLSPEAPDDSLLCGRCQRRPLPIRHAYCALRYEYPAVQLIHRLKYAQGLVQARVLAALLAQYLTARRTDHWPDCIVPVPLHTQRFRARGYNQVIEVGRHLAQLLNIPLRTDLAVRLRATPEQAGLSQRQRRRNLRGAFALRTRSIPRHIALLDDVVTTGSTLRELSKIFLKQHVSELEIWGIARVAPHSNI